VADPGFDLRGGVGGGRKSLKVLTVQLKCHFLACSCHISIKIMLKMNRERRTK